MPDPVIPLLPDHIREAIREYYDARNGVKDLLLRYVPLPPQEVIAKLNLLERAVRNLQLPREP